MAGKRIGFIGLGTMGSAMAGRLLAAGFDVTVYNRTQSRSEALGRAGARIAGSPGEASKDVDALLLSLADSAAVESVLFGAEGALGGLPGNAVIADMSTVSPAFAQDLPARVAPHPVVDACVLGNAEHARTGELRFMVGGDRRDYDAIKDVLAPLAKEVTHLGRNGLGASMKLTLNLLMGIEMQALAEAVVFGERAGLPRAAIIQMIASSGFSSPVMRFKASVMERRAFGRADFRLSLMRKDMALVLAECQRLVVPMPASEATYGALTAAVQLGLGDLDCASILTFMERISGLEEYSWPVQDGT
jgi:3-hydroxyisobutyrate dehydrogenase